MPEQNLVLVHALAFHRLIPVIGALVVGFLLFAFSSTEPPSEIKGGEWERYWVYKIGFLETLFLFLFLTKLYFQINLKHQFLSVTVVCVICESLVVVSSGDCE